MLGKAVRTAVIKLGLKLWFQISEYRHKSKIKTRREGEGSGPLNRMLPPTAKSY